MGCLPDSGACERRFTEPFVESLNGLDSSSFVHKACLDREIRDRPQPEALYVDRITGLRLVIERKTVAWPKDYIELHQADHYLVTQLLLLLDPLVKDGYFLLELSQAATKKRLSLAQIAKEIATQINAKVSRLTSGGIVAGVTEKMAWRAREQRLQERGLWSSGPGLVAQWSSDDGLPPLPEALPDQLLFELRRLLQSAEAKFADYMDDRRILLLDPVGELQHTPAEWWEAVFLRVGVPAAIGSIWTASEDEIEFGAWNWSFDRVWPRQDG